MAEVPFDTRAGFTKNLVKTLCHSVVSERENLWGDLGRKAGFCCIEFCVCGGGGVLLFIKKKLKNVRFFFILMTKSDPSLEKNFKRVREYFCGDVRYCALWGGHNYTAIWLLIKQGLDVETGGGESHGNFAGLLETIERRVPCDVYIWIILSLSLTLSPFLSLWFRFARFSL